MTEDTVIGMAASAPAASTGLTIAFLASLGVLPLGAAGFLGWIIVKSMLRAPANQNWAIVGIVVMGLVVMVLARFGLRSPFFGIRRESAPD